jgi:hypothetical protein
MPYAELEGGRDMLGRYAVLDPFRAAESVAEADAYIDHHVLDNYLNVAVIFHGHDL